MNKFKKDVFSQNGEDGIIEEIVKRIGLKGTAIEFGGADGYFCSNIRHLEGEDWNLIQYDINPSGDVIHAKITPKNVNDLPGCQILSIDVDGMDMEIWAAYERKPAIVIIEINSSKDPEKDFYTPEEGANFSAMKRVGENKGYFLACHTGNMIFIDSKYIDFFPDRDETFNRSWL